MCSKSSSKESRKTVNSKLSDEQQDAERQLEEIKELHKYEERLQDVKLQSLRREMQIRREMQLREAELKLERTFKAHSNTDKSVRGQLVKEESEAISKVEESKQAQPSAGISKNSTESERRQNNVTRNPLVNSTFGLPMVFGSNVIPLTKFDGKKENWPRFIQTFKALVDNQPYDIIIKLAILEQHLQGTASDCVKGFPFHENSYPLILKTLEERFGDEEDRVTFHLTAIENLFPIKRNDTAGLRKFFDDLQAHVQVLEGMGPDVSKYLDDPRRMKAVVAKLPASLAIAWSLYKDEKKIDADLRALCDWLRRRIQVLEKAAVGGVADLKEKRTTKDASIEFSTHVIMRDEATQTTDERSKKQRSCWVCKDDQHWPNQCPVFRKMDVLKRKQLAKEKGACFRCLGQGHLIRNCKNKLKCQKEQCQGSHHTLLHRDQENKDEDRQEDQEGKVATVAVTKANKESKGSVALPIKRVVVRSENGQRVMVNCLEDPGSQVTLVTERLVDSLNIQRTKGNLVLSGIGNRNLRLQDEVTLEVSPESSEVSYSIQAHVIPKISNHIPSFDVNEVKTKYPHLRDVNVNLETGSIDLLIGQDSPALLRQLEARYGEDDEPYAIRTPLGWSICGPINKQPTQDRSSHFISTMHEPYQNTNINLRQFWEIERIPEYDMSPISQKDREILEETERSTIQVDGRYQVKLPWKKTTSEIPQTYDMALRRLESIERKLKKSPVLQERYHKAIEAYINEGYVSKLNERPTDTGWYLPHHPVISDYKNTKLRVVFDSAAKVDGVSLNYLLEKGPNLLSDLTGILLRFRKFAVGVAGDISKMFLRILLHPDDCKFHRFLWRENDNDEPTVYQFNCVTFGDRSSPFLAKYVIKRVTQDHGEEKPEAAEALNKDLYMDDLIHSCKTTQEAKTTVRDVCQILDNGSLNMRNWISNQPSALEEITDRVAPRSLQFGEQGQRVLGMNWNPQTDQISFHPQMEDVVWTKRGVLRQLAKLFDPLGLLAAFLVKGKILMQEL